jgi:hypothetical protein
MSVLRYVAVALCVGWIAVWSAENMFWIVPPPDLTVWKLLLTWLAYSWVAAAAVSAVMLTGATGWWAAFLGGAVLGYGIEGIIVGTIYDAFPLQLVWTPLAWHALIVGGVFVGLARMPMQRARAVVLWTLVASGAVVWSLYWPMEREVLPTVGDLALYLVVSGLVAVGAHRALDGLWPVAGVPRAVLWIAPISLLFVWGVGMVLTMEPFRLVIWPCLAVVVWALVRQKPGKGWAPPVSGMQAFLPLLPPVAVTLAAPPLWALTGGLGVNVAFAWTTGFFGLGLLIWAVARRPNKVRPGRGSP